MLVLVIFGVTDGRNAGRPRELTPVVIGLTVTLLISLLSPLTMACFNPARDLGPRLWSALDGWLGRRALFRQRLGLAHGLCARADRGWAARRRDLSGVFPAGLLVVIGLGVGLSPASLGELGGDLGEGGGSGFHAFFVRFFE